MCLRVASAEQEQNLPPPLVPGQNQGTMEEEIVMQLQNETGQVGDGLRVSIVSVANLSAVSISLAADALLIFILIKYRQLDVRTNVFVLNWALMNSIYLFFGVVFLSDLVMYVVPGVESTAAHCFEVHVDCALDFCSVTFVLLLLCDAVITTEKWPTSAICVLVYTVNFCVFVVSMILSDNRYFYIEIVANWAIRVVTLLLAVHVIGGDIYRCYSKEPFENHTSRFRWNLSRIYTYNLIVTTVSIYLLFVVGKSFAFFFSLVHVSYYLAGFYFLVYYYHADKNFRMCVTNLVKRDKYSMNDTLRIQDGGIEHV